jgi:hypothetical protein
VRRICKQIFWSVPKWWKVLTVAGSAQVPSVCPVCNNNLWKKISIIFGTLVHSMYFICLIFGLAAGSDLVSESGSVFRIWIRIKIQVFKVPPFKNLFFLFLRMFLRRTIPVPYLTS